MLAYILLWIGMADSVIGCCQPLETTNQVVEIIFIIFVVIFCYSTKFQNTARLDNCEFCKTYSSTNSLKTNMTPIPIMIFDKHSDPLCS